MNYEWGRAPEAGKWQRAVPVWFMSVILLALASGIGVWWVRQAFVWTPLQQFYLSAYARSALASSLAIRTGWYRLLLMENRRGRVPRHGRAIAMDGCFSRAHLKRGRGWCRSRVCG
jgi:hypothetical protein